MCVEAFSLCGFGDFQVKGMDYAAGRAEILCPDAFEAWAFLQQEEASQGAVCRYAWGVLCSFMDVLKRAVFECKEICCEAKGDGQCDFIVFPAT